MLYVIQKLHDNNKMHNPTIKISLIAFDWFQELFLFKPAARPHKSANALQIVTNRRSKDKDNWDTPAHQHLCQHEQLNACALVACAYGAPMPETDTGIVETVCYTNAGAVVITKRLMLQP